jgi:hypothetical protein
MLWLERNPVKLHTVTITIAASLLLPGLVLADGDPDRVIPVHCERGASLQQAIEYARPGTLLQLSGTCLGPIHISRNDLTLEGGGNSGIDGQKADALTLSGAQNVSLRNLEIKNGNNGVVETNGAHVVLTNVSVHDNALMGIQLEANSSALISGGSAMHNGVNGVDLEASSSLILSGSYTAKSNAVFGLNVNGSSSVTFQGANLVVDGNTLGIQIGTSSGAFITDGTTTISVSGNATTGLTVVSGAHMVAFGGTIISQNNGVHGISVDSKAGFDLDAAALVESHDNAGDGVHLEEMSVLTMFNTPAFSGAPGVTTLRTYKNGANGISVLTGSNLTVIHQAAISSTGNAGTGIAVDDGSGLTLIQSTVTGNAKDVSITFGSRGDITGTAVGTLTCDATVLLRGDTGIKCPK